MRLPLGRILGLLTIIGIVGACDDDPTDTPALACELQVDGIGAYAQVADAPELDFGVGDFTLEVSLERERSQVREDILTKKDLLEDSNHDLAIGIYSDDRAFGYLRESNTTANVYIMSTTLPAGRVHLALTRSDGIVTLYLNGVAQASTEVGYDVSSTGPLRIGANRPEISDGDGSPVFPFQGLIDEVRIWNRARSAAEISEGVDEGVDRRSSGLVAYYTFDQRGGGSVPDASSTVGDAVLMGGATTVCLPQ